MASYRSGPRPVIKTARMERAPVVTLPVLIVCPLPMSIIQSVHRVPTLPRCSLFDYIFPGVGNYEDTAFIDGLTGRAVTRGQVQDHALRLAGGLQRLGLNRGDVACIHALNSIEWINALMGCQAARVIVSPANYA